MTPLQSVFLKNDYSFSYSSQLEDHQESWSSACGQNLYLQPVYLKTLAKITTGIQFLYVVVYHKKEPVGVCYLQQLQVTQDFFTQKKFPDQIQSKITTKLLKRINGNLLLCGNLFATGTHGFYFKNKTYKILFSSILGCLKRDLCKQQFCSGINFMMVKEFREKEYLDVQKAIRKSSFAPFQVDVNMILAINQKWQNFEDYLASMKTKYRTRAKNVYKKTALVSCKEFTSFEIKENMGTIEQLYASVVHTASFNMVQLKANAFYEFKKELGDAYVFRGYYYKNKLIAFSTACTSSLTGLDANYVGVNYKVNSEIPIYQRILYDYVQLAIKHRVKELQLGRTAELIKSALGATPKTMNLYVKHTNPFFHVLLKPLLNNVVPSSYEIRKPFKKEAF